VKVKIVYLANSKLLDMAYTDAQNER